MSAAVYKTQIICELEKIIENGDKLILYDLDDMEMLAKICSGIRSGHQRVKVWTSEKSDAADERIRFISQDEMHEIMRLYYLYEFSDRVLVVSENAAYPGLMNYVSQGILTEEEVVRAFLYKL